MDKYCKKFKGGYCERVKMHVPVSWCRHVCRGEWDGKAIQPKDELPYKKAGRLVMAEHFAKAMVRAAKEGFKKVGEKEFVERLMCCTTCGNGLRCPYCGCGIKHKGKLISETACPNKKTYSKLKRYPPRNYWEVCHEKTSVIIMSRNETRLNDTIDSLFKNATGNIEVLVVLDGEAAEVDSRAIKILFNKPFGRRIGTNFAVDKAEGKYLFMLDAHCTMSEGWDTKLKCACDEKTIATCIIKSLNDDFQLKEGDYSFVRLDDRLQDKWWSLYKPKPDWKTIEKTMAFTGCGWMIRRDFYNELGGFDESLGQWGHTGSEWTLKACSNGGEVVLRTDVICGHLFESNKGNFVPDTISQDDFYNRMKILYGEWIFDFLKKWEIPESIEEPEVIYKQRIVTTGTSGLPWITCYMLYYGRQELANEAIECFLRQTYPNKKLLIVNNHPNPVWFEEEFDNIEVQNLPVNMFKDLNEKYSYAFTQLKTPWFTPWDDDDIYLPWHLENIAKYFDMIPRNGTPRKLGVRYRYKSRDNKIAGIGGKMWGNCLFETFDNDGNIYPRLEPNTTINCDRQIQALKWDVHWLDEPKSFIYRWGTGESHASSHTGEKGLKHCENIRKKKTAIKITTPMRPHWKRDYVNDVKEFDNGTI